MGGSGGLGGKGSGGGVGVGLGNGGCVVCISSSLVLGEISEGAKLIVTLR